MPSGNRASHHSAETARVKVLPTPWQALIAVRRCDLMVCTISTSRAQRAAPRTWLANRTGSWITPRAYSFCSLVSSSGSLFIADWSYCFQQLHQGQWLRVLAGQLVALGCSIAVDLCVVTEHLDARFDRAGIASADTGLQVEKQLFAASCIELAKLLRRKRWLPRDRLLECFVAGLLRNMKIRREFHAVGNRHDRLSLVSADAGDLLGDCVEGQAHALEVNRLGLDPSS